MVKTLEPILHLLTDSYFEVYLLLAKNQYHLSDYEGFGNYLYKAISCNQDIISNLDVELEIFIVEWIIMYKDESLTYEEWIVFDYFWDLLNMDGFL